MRSRAGYSDRRAGACDGVTGRVSHSQRLTACRLKGHAEKADATHQRGAVRNQAGRIAGGEDQSANISCRNVVELIESSYRGAIRAPAHGSAASGYREMRRGRWTYRQRRVSFDRLIEQNRDAVVAS